MLKKWGFFPLFHRLLTQGRGFTVTDSDPELTSPCVATETEELRKREEAGQWGVTTLRSEGREKRSLFFFLCVIVSVCVCLAAVFLPGAGPSDTQTHRHTHTSLKPALFTTSDLAVYRQLHQLQGDLSSNTAGFLQDGRRKLWPSGPFWNIT